jgi:DNA-binding cell septation regulator SpoVG
MAFGENRRKKMHSKHFLIERMRNVDWKKTVATLSVTILDEHQKPIVTIHDCKLIDGTNGFFVAAPSKKVEPYTDKNGNNKEYMDLAFFHDHRDELNELASNVYDPEETPKHKAEDAIPF